MVNSDNQCTATAKSTGERCQRAAVKGADVCYVHGGAAQQVQEKAQERLDRMADEVTAEFEERLDDLVDEYDRAEDPDKKVKLFREMRQCLTSILDRAGHGPTETTELTGDGGGSVEVNFNETVVETEWSDE